MSPNNSLSPPPHPEEPPSEESALVELVEVPTADAKSRLAKAINLLLNAGKRSSVDTDLQDDLRGADDVS